jgi:hypothetical protein
MRQEVTCSGQTLALVEGQDVGFDLPVGHGHAVANAQVGVGAARWEEAARPDR